LREFALRYTAAWCSKDPSNVAAFYSPSGSFTINNGSPSVGRQAITQAAHEFMSAFPDLQVLMDDLIEEQDRALYHWTLNGTNTDTSGTARKVRISGFETWHLDRDGLILESRGTFDQQEYERQLIEGASPVA
jgi:predicted ester cyclase